MSKKLTFGLIAGAAIIILGVAGFYIWGKASADVATKDFCNGLTKKADWTRCVANVVVLRGEMARLDAVRFKKVWRNMDKLRSFTPTVAVSTSPSTVTTSPTPTPTSTAIQPVISKFAITEASGGTAYSFDWTVSNATSCMASSSPTLSTWNGAKALAGTLTVTKTYVVAGSKYTLTCTGATGSTPAVKTITM